MSAFEVLEEEQHAPPEIYDQWLKCFDELKASSSADSGLTDALRKGTFSGYPNLEAQFNRQLVDTINVMLDKRVKRFLRDLNMLLSSGELLDIVPLFIRLRNEIGKCLFFTGSGFIKKDVRRELEDSVKTQMIRFWDDTVSFLKKQTMEVSGPDLEDALFLISRLTVFQ